jgi:hypothetical protein
LNCVNLLASRAMGGGGMPTDSPTFKISMREYEDMVIQVGDNLIVDGKDRIVSINSCIMA